MNTNATDQVIATVVPAEERLEFYPTHFPARYLVAGERMVFGWAESLSEDYNGAYWEFYTLSNGGFYMAPNEGEFQVVVPGNYFEKTVSADAFGIICTFFTLGNILAETPDEKVCDQYHALRHYASLHDEADLILAAID